MHNISILVNGSKVRGRKHDFLEKSVGGCTTYGVIAQWPDLTRWWARTAKQKWGCCSLWEKSNGTWFDGLCTTIDPRSGHWPQVDEKREILFGMTHKKALQLVTQDSKYVLVLRIHLCSLSLSRSITQVRSGQNLWPTVTVMAQNLETSGSHEMNLK